MEFDRAQRRALILGIVVGVILVTGYQFGDAKLAERAAAAEGAQLLVPAEVQAEFSFWYSAYAAVAIVVVSVPIWTLLTRYRATNWITAAGLGFIVTMGFWIVTNLGSVTPIWDYARAGIPFAFAGAIGGMVTWWARPKISV